MVQIIFHWSLTILLCLWHPYHVSTTEIHYNKTSKTLEIGVRVFIDDIEKTIRNTSAGRIDLLNINEKKSSEKLLQQYITQHLALMADGKAASMKFIGFETDGGSVWSYFECPNVSLLKTLEISNSILHNLKEQVNFIHLKAIDSDETIRLDYPETYKKFILSP